MTTNKLEIFEQALACYVSWCTKNGIKLSYYEKRPYWTIGWSEQWLSTERVTSHTNPNGSIRHETENVNPGELLHVLNNIDGVNANVQCAYDTTAGIAFTIVV